MQKWEKYPALIPSSLSPIFVFKNKNKKTLIINMELEGWLELINFAKEGRGMATKHKAQSSPPVATYCIPGI